MNHDQIPLVDPISIIKSDSQFTSQNKPANETPPSLTVSQANELLDKTNIPFIENIGQQDEEVRYYTNTFAGSFFVTDNGLTYSFVKDQKTGLGVSVKEIFVDSQVLQTIGLEKNVATVNYFVGNEENWHSNIPTYGSIALGQVWPSINVELKTYGKNVEKIFTVLPDGSVDNIRMSFYGIKDLSINDKGELLLNTGLGFVTMTKPIAYQNIDGMKKPVIVSYTVSDQSYGFIVGDYDNNHSLIIDPLLASTLIGGSGFDTVTSIALDGAGNVYVAGYTPSTNFPITTGAYQTTLGGGGRCPPCDAFVSKFNPTLTTLLASTFIGGGGSDAAEGIALDDSGNVYITGSIDYSNTPLPGSIGGENFPTTPGAYQRIAGSDPAYGVDDTFVSKFNPTLTTLLASTLIDRNTGDAGKAITFDSSGNVYVAGQAAGATGTNFPTAPDAYQTTIAGSFDVFVSKFNPTLTTLLASTLIGGSDIDDVKEIAVDNSGNVYVAGNGRSTNYPTTDGAYQRTFGGSVGTTPDAEAFVSKFNPTLTTLLASTFIGGSSLERSIGIALDNSGNVYVAGETTSTNFPTTPDAYQTAISGDWDTFVSKFNPTLTTLLASTLIGGVNSDSAEALTLDGSGNVYVAGSTGSTNYPTTPGAYQTTFGGTVDAFVSKFNPTLTTLLASTLIGRAGVDGATAIVIDSSNNVYVAGDESQEGGFPTTVGAYQTTSAGSQDGFVSKFTPDLSLKASTTTTLTSSTNPSIFGQSVTFTATVSPSTATGTVTFYDGAITLGAGTLSSGQATFSTSSLSVGSHSITASYSGDGNFNTSTSGALSQTVDKAAQAVVCTPLPSGAVSWWRAEENANDSVGGNHGMLNGATFAIGKVGQAFSLDGVNDKVGVVHNSNLNVQSTGFTAEFWMKGNPSQSQSLYNVIDKSHGFIDNTGWTFQGVSSTGELAFVIGAGGPPPNGNFRGVQSSSSLLDNAYHHVAGTWNGITMTLYVDGVVQGTDLLTSPANNSRDLIIGQAWGGGTAQRFFNGNVDEVTIYNRALSSSEIAAIFNAGSVGKCKANTTTAITSSLNPSVFGQSVTFTATIDQPSATGTVEFAIDGVSYGIPVTVSEGIASSSISTLSVGTHTITATYSGDGTFATSTSDALTQIVNLPIAPAFSRSIDSLFDGPTCLQMEAEETGIHYWYVKPDASDTLTIHVNAVSVNPVDESGSIAATLFDGATNLGTTIALHPVSPSPVGSSNSGTITFSADPTKIYRLEVSAGPAILPQIQQARHYSLEVTGGTADLGITSPSQRYSEHELQAFHLNMSPGETLGFNIFVDPPPTNDVNQATSVSFSVRDGTGVLLYSQPSAPISPASPMHVVVFPTATSADTRLLLITGDGHFRVSKTSGPDTGLYVDGCPKINANDDSSTTNEDNSVIIPMLSNDTPFVSISGNTNPTNGNVIINPEGTITYTPNANFAGIDTFTYTISDGFGGMDTALVTVTVNPVNDPPVAVDDFTMTSQGASVDIAVLGNDSDPENNNLAVQSFTQPANGLVSDPNNDGVLTFTPNAGFFGTDTFTYTISDGFGGTSSATVNVTVEQVIQGGPTRTQGFWSTHLNASTQVWNSMAPSDRIIGTKNMGNSPASSDVSEMMGGFWSNVAKKSDNSKRTTLDQTRMQLIQQLLAAMLNKAAFGTDDGGLISAGKAAFAGTNTSTILSVAADLASFNEGGDSIPLPSGFNQGSADPKSAQSTANKAFWNILP